MLEEYYLPHFKDFNVLLLQEDFLGEISAELWSDYFGYKRKKTISIF